MENGRSSVTARSSLRSGVSHAEHKKTPSFKQGRPVTISDTLIGKGKFCSPNNLIGKKSKTARKTSD